MPQPNQLSPKEKIGDAAGKAVIGIFFVAPLVFVGLYFTWELFLAPLFRGKF